MFKSLIAWTLLLPGLLAPVLAYTQADSLAIGGPDESKAYEEVVVEGEEETLEGGVVDGAASGVWTLADSLAFVPAYDLYCGFNTHRIFDGEPSMSTALPLDLHLSHASCDHAIPVCGKVTSAFGPRRGRWHYGVDLKLQTGDPVYAAFEGMVRISRYNPTFGHVVVIRHANGLETLYAHLSKRSVHVGEVVEAGACIGLGGNTGRSTGSHLHFEVRYLGKAIDPSLVFDLEEGELHSQRLTLTARSFEHLTRHQHHVVRRGDTLSSIARRYGTSVDRLCRTNRISARSTLRVGQVIRVL